MIVSLSIPDHISFQLVYRLDNLEPVVAKLDEISTFVFLTSPAQALRWFRTVTSYCGTIGSLKTVAKLLSGRRSLYLITQNGRVTSAGWCYTGRCKYYKIEHDAIVIGPIWTKPEARGKGLALKALQLAMNEYRRRGHSLFYIDTEKNNQAAQRVFEKCGFGAPVALYFR